MVEVRKVIVTAMDSRHGTTAPGRRLRGFLPPNVEVFTISFIQFHGKHLMRGLVDLLAEPPPSLKVMRLEGTVKTSRELWPGLVEVMQLARTVGIDLIVLDGAPPYIFPRYEDSRDAVEREMWAPRTVGFGVGQVATILPDAVRSVSQLEHWAQWS